MAPKKTAKKPVSATVSAAGAALAALKNRTISKSGGSVARHIAVKALAGTGKTTTIVQGIRHVLGMKTKIQPSEEQAAIWEVMAEGETPSTIRVAAFNKSIAFEVANRLEDVPQCEVKTMHAFGFSILKDDPQKRFPRSMKVNGWRVTNILEKLTSKDNRQLRKDGFPINAIERLVSLCKINLIDWNAPDFEDQFDILAAHYDVEVNGSRTIILEMVPRVLEACRTPEEGKHGDYFPEIDYDDMVWLPYALDMQIKPADWCIIDEAQDLNRAQQALVAKLGRRQMYIGDVNQAIYGFAGADSESMPRIISRLEESPEGVIVLPLNQTRRCGHAIVAEAAKIVPDFTAHASNPVGEVGRLPAEKFMETVAPTDMVVCRINAPLVSTCFRLLKDGRKARIQGRDIGEGLIRLVKNFKAKDIEDLMAKLETWHTKEEEKLLKSKFKSEAQLIALQDKFDCLMVFADGVETVDDLTALIDQMFDDLELGDFVRLSSIHRAKGLEADTVYILNPELLPHPMAKMVWQVEQEKNLKYVSYTRAIHRLILVETVPKK